MIDIGHYWGNCSGRNPLFDIIMNDPLTVRCAKAEFDYGGISISLEITQLNVTYLEKKHIFYETTAYQREFFVGGVCLVVI